MDIRILMGLFYKVSNKQSLKDRNQIFKEVGIPALEDYGFIHPVFKTSWDGQYNHSIKGYCYEFARLQQNRYLEIINTYILSGESRIQIYLNIFEISPQLESVTELNKYEGLNFSIPPNNITRMLLRSDDYKGPPIFYMIFLPEHKIGNYYTKAGYETKLKKLKILIQSDMKNINKFIKRWHELHKPNITDYEGNIINNISM